MAGLGLETVASLVLYPSIFLLMIVLLVTSDRKIQFQLAEAEDQNKNNIIPIIEKRVF